MIINKEKCSMINDLMEWRNIKCEISPNETNEFMWVTFENIGGDDVKIAFDDVRDIYNVIARLMCTIETVTGVRI